MGKTSEKMKGHGYFSTLLTNYYPYGKYRKKKYGVIFLPQASKTNKCSPLAPSTPIHFATRLNQMQLDSVQWDLMGSEQALRKQALIGPILYQIISSFHHMTLNCKLHFTILE